MKTTPSDLKELLIIEPNLFKDNRGWFMESYNHKELAKLGINVKFVQDNHAKSKKKGTLRGLHFQNNPHAQSKLVRCTKGALLDVIVDIRKSSLTYKKWVAIKLTENNCKQVFIPRGFAHGYLTLENDTEIQYKTDQYYNPKSDRSVKYNDPDIGIKWGCDKPILSDKDKNAPSLKDSDANFK